MFSEIVDWPDSISDPEQVAAALTVLLGYARDRPQLPDRRDEHELVRLLGLPMWRDKNGHPAGPWHPYWSQDTGPPPWHGPPPPPALAVADLALLDDRLDRRHEHAAYQWPDELPQVGTALVARPGPQLVVADPSQLPGTPEGTHALLRAANTAAACADALTAWADKENARNAPGWRQEARAAQDLAQAAYDALESSTASWLPTVRELVRVDLSVRAEKTPPPPIVPVHLRVTVP